MNLVLAHPDAECIRCFHRGSLQYDLDRNDGYATCIYCRGWFRMTEDERLEWFILGPKPKCILKRCVWRAFKAKHQRFRTAADARPSTSTAGPRSRGAGSSPSC
jgi:hypothetical protein